MTLRLVASDAFLSFDAQEIRAILPGYLAGYFDSEDPGFAEGTRSGVARILAGQTDEDLEQTWATLARAGRQWRVHEADPILRVLSRAWMSRCMPDARVIGLENLPENGRGCLWVCNHISYVDTQVKDSLLWQRGVRAVDDMLTVAGPKVYTEPFRLVAATALHTLMTPQSRRVITHGASLTRRETLRVALGCIKSGVAWMNERGPLLVYPEGSRSRTGRLGGFLRAAARYVEAARLVVPIAVTGTDQLFAFDERMRVAQVSLIVGQPFEPGAYAEAELERSWERIAELLPAAYGPPSSTRALR